MAILLRNPDRQQVLVEEALRRARIPAYMSRGSARPDPSGRALLALLACCHREMFGFAVRGIPVVRSSAARGGSERACPMGGAADETLSTWDRARRGNGAARELAKKSPTRKPPFPGELYALPRGGRNCWWMPRSSAGATGGRDVSEGSKRNSHCASGRSTRTDDPRRTQIERQLEQLKNLEQFALPLIETLDLLPSAALWSEWIERLSHLARVALRRPEPVLAVLAEFEPMSDTGPATLEEVARVLSERLRFLRREPPRRRWGRVFVGSIEESRGREFHTVFLPGLAEGMFPQRALEDPLLLDPSRKAMGDCPSLAIGPRDRRAASPTACRGCGARATDRFLFAHGRRRGSASCAVLLCIGTSASRGGQASRAERL